MAFFRYLILHFVLFQLCLTGDVKGTQGQIKFDINNDTVAEMTLNTIGLGIGTSPSSNLHIMGNALITGQISIGSSTSNSSNLYLSGSLGYGVSTLRSDTDLSDEPHHSMLLLDTQSDNINLYLPYAANVTGREVMIKKNSTNNEVYIFGGGNLIDQYMQLTLGSDLSSLTLIAGESQWYLLDYLAGNDNITIYQDDFYIDGVIRVEPTSVDGTQVGSFSDHLNFTSYTWSVNNSGGLVTRYNLPGASTTGDAGMFYSNSTGADSITTVNFDNFSQYSTLELSADMRALDCMGLSMGFGTDNGLFSTETGDALYIKSDGGTGSANVSLIARNAGVDYILETVDDHDTINSSLDTMVLFYHRINNTISGSFYDADNGIHSFSTYSLDSVGGGFTPTLNLTKYEIFNEQASNSNFPSWQKTSLKGSSNP